MSFGIGNNVRSKVRECTPELFNRALESRVVAEVCAQIKDALEAVRRGDMSRQDFETLKGDAEVAATIKPATDFMGKLNKNTRPVFFDVYNASVTVLKANEAEDNAAVAEAEATLAAIKADTKPETRTSPYWLIFTYLILTFAELLLSPMGISFVSKVAPPKLKGLMMGGWFVATAIGNMLVAVGGFLWAGLPLWSVWTVFIVLCLLSALFMFIMMKRLEAVTK